MKPEYFRVFRRNAEQSGVEVVGLHVQLYTTLFGSMRTMRVPNIVIVPMIPIYNDPFISGQSGTR